MGAIFSLPYGFVETLDSKGEDDASENGEGGQLRPEDIGPHSLEKNSADDDEEITDRIQIGEPLDRRRHVLYGKGET